MQVKIFTIPIGDSGNAEREMNAFLRGNKILEVENQPRWRTPSSPFEKQNCSSRALLVDGLWLRPLAATCCQILYIPATGTYPPTLQISSSKIMSSTPLPLAWFKALLDNKTVRL